MNRRTFIAGLLASSAAVPLRSPFAADMPDAAAPELFDVVPMPFEPSIAYIMRARSIGYMVTEAFRIPPNLLAAEPAPLWLDEASDFVVYDDGAVEGWPRDHEANTWLVLSPRPTAQS